MAIVFIVLLVVLAGLIWGLPMVLGPEFSLTNIVGSLLGSSAQAPLLRPECLPRGLRRQCHKRMTRSALQDPVPDSVLFS